MKELQKYLQKTISYHEFDDNISLDKFQEIRPRIICKDGESVSIQAGKYLYSSPRLDGCKYYDSIEAGYPSVIPPLSWKEYADEWEIGFLESLKKFLRAFFKDKFPTLKRIYWKQLWNPMPTQTIYAYMPVETAQEFIDAHGGIDLEKSLPEEPLLNDEITGQLEQIIENSKEKE